MKCLKIGNDKKKFEFHYIVNVVGNFFLQPTKSCFNEFGYRTMDYSVGDLAQARNEVVLISIVETRDSIRKKL